MPGPKVFVSYSHQNKRALDQLLRFLRPLEREGLLGLWEDTRLQASADWEREIEQALADANVALLLISQDFLASDFIVRKELPWILQHEAGGRLAVVPVFLSPSLVEDLSFPDPRKGGREKVSLSRFQGCGDPRRPLSALSWSDRERMYADLARRLQGLPAAQEAAGGYKPAAAPSAVTSHDPAKAYELTVELEVREGTLYATYHIPGREPLGSARAAWAGFEPRIEALRDRLSGQPTDCGSTLFDLLFPRKDQLGKELLDRVLRFVFGRFEGQPSPVFGPVRLRVRTEDSRLSGLPWRLASWSGRPLLEAGWTFTTTHTVEAVDDQVTTAPCNVLLLMPQVLPGDTGLHDPEHARAVYEVLTTVWPTGKDSGYVQVARTRQELEAGLRSLRPRVLYVYGHGTVQSDHPCLLLEGARGAEPLPLSELRDLFSTVGHTPAALYLNVQGWTGLAATVSAPDQILEDLPLLFWRRCPDWFADSTTLALHWLRRWLGQGEDPVAAFHRVERDAIPPGRETAMVAIHSNYRAWRTSTYEASSQPHYPSLRLDRDHQKSLVRKHLEELVRSSTRRVMALVPYAAPRNHLQLLSDQLRHDLELSLSHLAQIQRISLQFPESLSNLARDLEEELKLQLGAGPREEVMHLLRRHAPKVVAPGRKAVLWLDWGVFGGDSSATAELNDESLQAWLQFASSYLSVHCPSELRIVAFAAQEIPTTCYDAFANWLKEQRRQPWCRTPAFRLSELPPLGTVAESDLLDFLEDPANSSCDPGIQAEIAERVITKTGGEFEETIQLLQQAESGSWYDLLNRLRREQGARTP